MKRYKVSLIIRVESETGPDYLSIEGMLDRVLSAEFRDKESPGRPGGYLDCSLEEISAEVVPPVKCNHCNGTGEQP